MVDSELAPDHLCFKVPDTPWESSPPRGDANSRQLVSDKERGQIMRMRVRLTAASLGLLMLIGAGVRTRCCQ